MSKRRQQKIIHPLFGSMADNEKDPYWQLEFRKASFGKFPQRFTFKGGILIFTKSNRKEKMLIPNDVLQAIENYKAFIRKHTLCKSRLEYEEDNKRNEEKINNNKSIEEYSWKSIKKKKIKEVLITNFINNISNSFELDKSQRYELSCKINLGIILGIINPSSFDYVDGEIKSIDQINYDHETKSFFLEMNAKKKDKPQNDVREYSLLDKITNPILSIDREWKMYIDNHINKNETNYQVIVYDSTSYEVSSL